MFVKRMTEIKLLEDQYLSSGSNLVVLYGRKGLGKTALLSEFMEGKPSYYYEGVECVDILQVRRMNRQLAGIERAEDCQGLPFLLTSILSKQEQKAVIILDEFHLITKNCPDFIDIFSVLANVQHPVMLVLCSSSIRWVENDMIDYLGAKAAYITSFIKLKEFSFVDFVNRFPKASVETCIYINAILGGVPEYLNAWQDGKSVKDNIISIILDKDSRLFEEPQQFLKLELREPAVYNTILSELAQGNRKLNDLHARTGFSRAKIIVYLKALIQLDLVEKLVPVGEEGRENAQKGLYRIKDNYFSFWYLFVFPNLSDLMLGKASSVYENKIEPYLDEYMGEYFSDVCTEFLKLMNVHHRLPKTYLWWDRWYGKHGTIDVIAQGEKNTSLVGKCLFTDRKMESEDYEKLLSLSEEAGLKPEFIYLFSKSGFSDELRNYTKENSNVIIVGLEDL
ncbi:MAG TPA: ATP-binding protein [Mobilitalea sp.]|nr:ATP-binding protein [Mobilitalea sp.]